MGGSTATTLSCANLAFQAINIYLSLALFGKPTLTVGLVCGSLLTLSSAGIYTYFKISKVLEKDAGCVKKNEDFKSMCGKVPLRVHTPQPAASDSSSSYYVLNQ